jgi:hypothetical protein
MDEKTFEKYGDRILSVFLKCYGNKNNFFSSSSQKKNKLLLISAIILHGPGRVGTL